MQLDLILDRIYLQFLKHQLNAFFPWMKNEWQGKYITSKLEVKD